MQSYPLTTCLLQQRAGGHVLCIIHINLIVSWIFSSTMPAHQLFFVENSGCPHTSHILLRMNSVVVRWSHSEGPNELNILPDNLLLFCPYEATHITNFEHPVMLHAIFPLYFTVIPCVSWLAVECGYCRVEGGGTRRHSTNS